MSQQRLAALSAAVLGVGWLLAVIVNLFFWLPQSIGVEPSFYDDSGAFLRFVAENQSTWQIFHIGTTTGLMGLVFLVPLLASERKGDGRGAALTAVGLVGAIFALLASLIDQFGTPVLARAAAEGSTNAPLIWEFMEPWRDAGLKTVSFYFLGAWVTWLGGGWLQTDARRLGIFSRILGLGLLLLAVLETVLPQPWRNILGETGLAGLVVLLFPVWGLWLAGWLWREEYGVRSEK